MGIKEGSVIVPLKVIENITKLVLNYVEVYSIGPIVPEVDHLANTIIVHDQYGVELVGPWGWGESWPSADL